MPVPARAQAQLANNQLHRRSHYTVPHTYMAVDAGICQVASIYEEVEHFGGSVAPLPAQNSHSPSASASASASSTALSLDPTLVRYYLCLTRSSPV